VPHTLGSKGAAPTPSTYRRWRPNDTISPCANAKLSKQVLWPTHQLKRFFSRAILNTQSKHDVEGGIPAGSLSPYLRNWVFNRGSRSISLKENTDPANDPHDDYKVVYEAQFNPERISQMKLELMLTDNGRIGVGLETRQRVAGRLNVRNHRQGFAAGFEPLLLTSDELQLLLSIVSGGELVIRARVIPWYGLASTRVLLMSKREGAPDLFKKFYSASSLPSNLSTKTLTFEPWQ
jgi:hypothetical protein